MSQLPPIARPSAAEMTSAVLERDTQFEGIFVFAVRTTGIVCRPGCPAKSPRPTNIEFFDSTRDALLAGYRPCKRCRPMDPRGAAPEWVTGLLEELESDPELTLRDADLRARDIDPTRLRRWFKTHHGMTFHGYQRSRRLGRALGQIRRGADLSAAGLDAGYQSESGFRDAFRKLFGAAPGEARGGRTLAVTRILTPLGAMLAAATETHLCLLEFVDRRMLQTQIDRLRGHLEAEFVPGDNEILARTDEQLAEYFAGERREFELPLETPGTEFQRAAWSELQNIPYGASRTYAQQAEAMGRAAAVRAVGKANGDNRIAIVIPCHRVVGANGKLVGYGGQLWRKQALLDLERGERSFSFDG